jgi:hypothetical protein
MTHTSRGYSEFAVAIGDSAARKFGLCELETSTNSLKERLRDYYEKYIRTLNSLSVFDRNGSPDISKKLELLRDGMYHLCPPHGIDLKVNEKKGIIEMYYCGKKFIPRKPNIAERAA